MSKEKLIYDLSRTELADYLLLWNEPGYRLDQLWQGIYHHFWESPQEFTNIPKSLRERLFEEFTFQALKPIKVIYSNDGETQKTLFSTRKGNPIETVLMQYKNRYTLCISSQSGCGMGCKFCATGQLGFKANLSSGEIIAQVLYYSRILSKQGKKLTNIVVMGMGEPFHNFEQTLAAIDRLNDPQGFNFGERRFTISTVGIVPQIQKFTQLNRQINLAISLHAADDELRSSIMPINQKYPIAQLIHACRDYVQQTHRRITFEWAMIKDFNDSLDQARKLVSLVKDFQCHVNLIPLNPTPSFSGSAANPESVSRFQQYLLKHHIPCTIRLRRGIDIQAGCGQLASNNSVITSFVLE
ncbi:MAG: 23S rRNA (adenine(2503)-C(2))-methyltransferase RlmN [Anaerolineales bacterium]